MPPRESSESINSIPVFISSCTHAVEIAFTGVSPWNIMPHTIPSPAPNEITGRDGILSISKIITTSIGTNANKLIWKFSWSAAITLLTCVISALPPPRRKPRTVNAMPVIPNALNDTGKIPRTWSITSISAIAADNTQLSESGESLSPK